MFVFVEGRGGKVALVFKIKLDLFGLSHTSWAVIMKRQYKFGGIIKEGKKKKNT